MISPIYDHSQPLQKNSLRRDRYHIKYSITAREFNFLLTDIGWNFSLPSTSHYYWFDTSSHRDMAQLFKANCRFRIKEKPPKYWIQYKAPISPQPIDNFRYLNFDEFKWRLKRKSAKEIIHNRYLITSCLNGYDLLNPCRLTLVNTSISEKRIAEVADLTVMIERFRKQNALGWKFQLEISSRNPASVLTSKQELSKLIHIRKAESKLNYIWKD